MGSYSDKDFDPKVKYSQVKVKSLRTHEEVDCCR